MKLLIALILCFALSGAAPAPTLRRYDTSYYVIHTDLPPDGAAEAVVRMSRLADELRRRTRDLGFTGRIQQRLPFFLYARHADYVASGAPPQSAGTFDGDRLVAAATDSRGSATWNVVQHEAFHQFAAATSGTELPAWLNEGFGEYFGEALFTGDAYVTGVVPEWRLRRVRQSLSDHAFEPLAGFARLTQEQWNQKLSIPHYDQAWSLVQFLLHSDDTRHHHRLLRYVRALADGTTMQQAWTSAFGDAADLEKEWKAYWLNLPEKGTPELEAEATVATLTSFLARATAAGQSFDSFDAFTRAARNGTLKCDPRDWLPPSLLGRTIESIPQAMSLKLEGEGENSHIVTVLPQGRALIGLFTLKDGRVTEVQVVRDSR
jgi:hypothetical protein